MAREMKQESSGEHKGNTDDKQNAVSEEEVRQESSKAANAAANAQNKAKELRDAAAGAGDPDERQKLVEQAIDKEVEAESFGKTAKYLRSGAFQGMAIGAGLGTAPSASLGALTGTLVGSVTTVITGGLGGGVGAAAGAIHGPVVNMGKLAGKGVRKITGNLPGWVASPEQKQALEKMVGQVNDTEMPDDDELKKLRKDGGDVAPDEGWLDSAKGMLPSTNNSDETQDDLKGKAAQITGSNEAEEEKSTRQKDIEENSQDKEKQQPRKQQDDKDEPSKREMELREQIAKKDAQLSKLTDELKAVKDELQYYKDRDSKSNELEKASDGGDAEAESARRKPRKLEAKSDKKDAGSKGSENSKPQPRKLEKRSS
ncbi:hypothetical protein DE146DRAFT_193849 [Phaeosphaeria sp. MPI-PUGE-AT-0046c]|nr:hypothetical protein DE146DRAFT_193849 [Phaeosphaeria sp. MPI-PUGE-AT-0046c]